MVTTTLCVSGMALAKAGIGYNTNLDGTSAAMVGSDFIVDLWIVEAESFINVSTKYDWVTAYAALNANYKKILQETASARAAIHAINYDYNGFGSRLQAENKINVLNNIVTVNVSVLSKPDILSFMGKP